MSKVERLEIAQIENSKKEIKPLLRKGALDLVKDVKVTLEVRVGESEMTVNEFMNLGQGSVVQMNHPTTEPVDLLIDGRIVARGRLVAADDNFGVQISELKT
jgi:flagellar motor switch protein FliN/FliY